MTGRPSRPAADKPYHHGALRGALLLAAEAELEARGIEHFSLRKVAQRAGVSHGAPAYHFRDSGGLLTALATDGFARVLATQLDREEQQGSSLPDRLVAAGLGYIDFALRHPALFRLMFSSQRLDFGDPDLQREMDSTYQHLRAAIAAVDGAEADVILAWAVVHGLAELMLARRLVCLHSLPLPEREAALAVLLRRLLPPGASSSAG